MIELFLTERPDGFVVKSIDSPWCLLLPVLKDSSILFCSRCTSDPVFTLLLNFSLTMVLIGDGENLFAMKRATYGFIYFLYFKILAVVFPTGAWLNNGLERLFGINYFLLIK